MDYGDNSWAFSPLAALVITVFLLVLLGLKNEREVRRMAEQEKKIITKNQQRQIRFANQLVKKGYPPSIQQKYLMSEFGLTPEQAGKVLTKSTKMRASQKA